jgi:hypothetical protein
MLGHHNRLEHWARSHRAAIEQNFVRIEPYGTLHSQTQSIFKLNKTDKEKMTMAYETVCQMAGRTDLLENRFILVRDSTAPFGARARVEPYPILPMDFTSLLEVIEPLGQVQGPRVPSKVKQRMGIILDLSVLIILRLHRAGELGYGVVARELCARSMKEDNPFLQHVAIEYLYSIGKREELMVVGLMARTDLRRKIMGRLEELGEKQMAEKLHQASQIRRFRFGERKNVKDVQPNLDTVH